ncbi:MAG: hypothetical protein CMJ58_26530 [Planctomycetaceae bacterium]|nr:hypothetical protein [Planctomycetaceae bacterium]
MAEIVQEFVDSRGVALRVDRDAGVLRGVKLIGLESRNGRRYRPDALAQAAALYEAAKVNVNHPKGGPLTPRDYQDRLGVIRNVEFRTAEGLFGDLHFNPKHALAEQLAWDAEHNPRNVGFSHNVLARLSREGDASVVEEITRVQSVDLVADPATTEGLFEQQGDDDVVDESAPAWDALTLATLAVHRPDLLDEIRSQQAALVSEQMAAAGREARTAERRLAIAEALAARGIAPPADEAGRQRLLGAAFCEALTAANDRQFAKLLAERVQSLPRGSAPCSVEQRMTLPARMPAIGNAADFARAIRR